MLKPKEWQREREKKENERRTHLSYKIHRSFSSALRNKKIQQ
jgi:hypothetical protein